MGDPVPVPVPAGLEWFASFISERMGRLEGQIERLRTEIRTDFVMKHEIENTTENVDRAHSKYRELEARVHTLELSTATNAGGDKVRWEFVFKVVGALGMVALAIIMTWLKIK